MQVLVTNTLRNDQVFQGPFGILANYFFCYANLTEIKLNKRNGVAHQTSVSPERK